MTVQQNYCCQRGKILPLYQDSGNGSRTFTKQVLWMISLKMDIQAWLIIPLIESKH